MKHSAAWWILIGWWWYLCFAWWVYPIKRFFSKKSSNAASENRGRLLHETERYIMNFLNNSNGGAALQVDIKRTLPSSLTPYFDEAVHELYQNGEIKTSKDGGRIRLELVGTANTGWT